MDIYPPQTFSKKRILKLSQIRGVVHFGGGQFKGRLTLEATLVVWGVKGTLEAERYLVVSSNDPIFLGRR